MKKILPCAIALLSLIACNSNQPEQDKSIMVPQKTATTMDSTNMGQQSATANPAMTAAPTTTAMPSAQPKITAATAAALAASGGLNPEHGQPNHRCDIPVGAPLSTPAQSAQSQTVQTVKGAQPAISTGTPASVPNNSTAKLNPPHGEPGHDCKIPVGQPLN
jgi:hypothetical protein